MKKHESVRVHTKKLVFSALMLALSILIGAVCKAFFTVTPITRITFDTMPIILLGFLFGPVYSTMAAVGADLVSALIAGYAPTPFITVGAAAIGAVSGVLARYIIKRKNFISIASVSLAAHAIGSMLIKTYGLADLYGMQFSVAFWARLPFGLLIAAVEAYLIYIVLKNDRISSLAGGKGATK